MSTEQTAGHLLAGLDKYPDACKWRDVLSEGRQRIVNAGEAALIAELRSPTTNSVALRDATVREALARILERKP